MQSESVYIDIALVDSLHRQLRLQLQLRLSNLVAIPMPM